MLCAAAGNSRRSRSSESKTRRRMRSSNLAIGNPAAAGCALTKFINCQMATPRARTATASEFPMSAARRVRSSRNRAITSQGFAAGPNPFKAADNRESVAAAPVETPGIDAASASQASGSPAWSLRWAITAATSASLSGNSGKLPMRTSPMARRSMRSDSKDRSCWISSRSNRLPR